MSSTFEAILHRKRSLRIAGGTKTLLAAFLALQLSSCALLSSGASRETYEINVAGTFSGISGGTGAQLLVKVPTALKALDSDRIIVRPSPNVITYLEGAQWSDTVPRMVQAKLVEAFQNTGDTGATAKPGDGLVIDYQLISDLRRFEIIEGVAFIEMSIKLLNDKSGQVLQTRIFTTRANSRGSSADAYIQAFDRAFDNLARDVIAWVFRTV